MTKSELIKKIHHNNELNFVEVEKIVKNKDLNCQCYFFESEE